MTIQQLLSQCSVEDIVRTTMAVYDMDEAKYSNVYTNYAKLIETLLKLETIPTDDILLGIAYEDEGELHMDTSVYKADQLADGIPYSAIFVYISRSNPFPRTVSPYIYAISLWNDDKGMFTVYDKVKWYSIEGFLDYLV